MEGTFKITIFISLYATICGASSPATKDLRTGALLLPEKIIGGVIDIVQSHKNKPVSQPAYQQVPQGYQQYPQYPQWNGQGNYQNPGYPTQYQGQYQQYTSYAPQNGYQGPTYPQNGGSYSGNSGQMYQGQGQGQGQGFSNAQGQNQGQYQSNYQQPSGQYQQTQHFQTQGTGQYNGQHYGQGGQAAQVPQASGSGQIGSGGGGQGNQGFLVSGGSQNSGSAPGPACVCQAWTKPHSNLMKDSLAPEKTVKLQDTEQ